MASKTSTSARSKMAPIKVSQEELSYRSTQFSDLSAVSNTRLLCTKCDVVIKPRMVSEKNMHPVLEVLLCQKCRYFYEQRYNLKGHICCKWCASDKYFFECSACPAKFCEGCINKHFRLARTVFQEIRERKWKCCVCVPQPIWLQRAVCWAAVAFANNSRNALEKRKASIGARGRSSVVPALTTSQSNRSLSVSSVANSVDESRTTRVASSVPVARPAIKRKATTEVEAPCDRHKEATPKRSKTDPESCVICMAEPRTMLFYSCGHKCLCQTCANQWKLRRETGCPLCREPFLDIIRVFE